jgi:uncharacterized iron-regulated membrane protein
MNVVKGGKYFLVYVDPYSGNIIGERQRFTFLMDWLLRFHYSLFAEETGEMIVAVLGLLLIISVVTGIIVYRKYIVKVLLFKVPLRLKNWRQGASELHRIIGVWSLVFNLMIAITGFYMLYQIFLPSFSAEEAEELVQKPIELKIPLEKLLSNSGEVIPEFVPYSITVPSDSMALITVSGGVKDTNPLSSDYSSFVSFNQYTGEIEKVSDIRKQTFTNQLDKSMYTLHFGNYGGILIKIIYSIFGITPSFLAITGFLLWWRQSKKRQQLTKKREHSHPVSS